MQHQQEREKQEQPAGKAGQAAQAAADAAYPEDGVAAIRDDLLRAMAEAENLRRRTREQIAMAQKSAIEGFARALMPVKDSLEITLLCETPSIASLKEGVAGTLKKLSAAFEKNRLLEINPAPGEKLDPGRHQAISVVPAEQNANTIVSVPQKGYMLAGRLLRPALVTVAQGKPE